MRRFGLLFANQPCSHLKVTFVKHDHVMQIHDGDIIRIDAEKHSIDAISVDDAEWQRRKDGWKAPPLKFTSGVLYKYIKNVSSASLGCVTDL